MSWNYRWIIEGDIISLRGVHYESKEVSDEEISNIVSWDDTAISIDFYMKDFDAKGDINHLAKEMLLAANKKTLVVSDDGNCIIKLTDPIFS